MDKEKMKQYNKNYYEKNKEIILQNRKEYYKNNIVFIKEYETQYHEENKDRISKYYKNNKVHRNRQQRQCRSKTKQIERDKNELKLKQSCILYFN